MPFFDIITDYPQLGDLTKVQIRPFVGGFYAVARDLIHFSQQPVFLFWWIARAWSQWFCSCVGVHTKLNVLCQNGECTLTQLQNHCVCYYVKSSCWKKRIKSRGKSGTKNAENPLGRGNIFESNLCTVWRFIAIHIISGGTQRLSSPQRRK